MTDAVVFVTGNPNKLAEARAILPFEIENAELDLAEIQSMDVHEVVDYKLMEAYRQIGKAVMVDDVSVALESLNGLPGPFIKFYEERLGKGALYRVSTKENDRVAVTCCIGYFDGKRKEIVEGTVYGAVVSPRGEQGWGFDFVVVPDGYDQTWAEMGPEMKNKTSHRYAALVKMAEKLKSLSQQG